MLIAAIGTALLVSLAFAFVLGMRALAKKCTRQHQIGGEGAVSVQAGRAYSGRTCCPTPPDTAHAGTCDNSLMRSGGWWPERND